MKVGLNRLTRIIAFLAIGLSLGTVSVITASADARICSQLEAELASAGIGERSSAQVKKYDIAVDRQRGEIQKARARARGERCSPSLFGDGSSKCGALNTKIERMERNLEALQRKRAQLASGKAGRARARIMAALDANGCRDDAVAERRLPNGVDNNRNVLEQILGGGVRQPQSLEELGEERDDPHVRRLPDPLDWNAGRVPRFSEFPALAREFRTLCVRTCDGYFFPMSAASSLGDLDRDQKNCESRCPGTDVQVYYRPMLGEEPSDMISAVSGAPYSELPTAYLYRKSGTPRPAGCGCNAPKNFETITGNPPSQEPTSAKSIIQLPVPTTDPTFDPATTANDRGQESQTSGRKTDASTPKTMGEEDRKVRVVGPRFLPDPEAAIDLRAPAPKKVP